MGKALKGAPGSKHEANGSSYVGNATATISKDSCSECLPTTKIHSSCLASVFPISSISIWGPTRGQAGAKPTDRGAHHQRHGGHLCLFPRTGSIYAAEITVAIPNLHAGLNAPNQWVLGLNAPNQWVLAGEAGFSKSKKPFTRPYRAYHRFYGDKIMDYYDIHTLEDQRTQMKDKQKLLLVPVQ
ncbi:hypothetical protein Fot_06048 [Forsythia ovata]|uniref:Uncharacterized protein n=1 Tax=Forsythia ovata TaxID=205694 RepID=A0ABD1WRY8_9LAMI